MIKEKYAIMRNGKYLTNLFEDDIEKNFQSSDINEAYKYNIRAIAESVAKEFQAEVIILHCK